MIPFSPLKWKKRQCGWTDALFFKSDRCSLFVMFCLFVCFFDWIDELNCCTFYVIWNYTFVILLKIVYYVCLRLIPWWSWCTVTEMYKLIISKKDMFTGLSGYSLSIWKIFIYYQEVPTKNSPLIEDETRWQPLELSNRKLKRTCHQLSAYPWRATGVWQENPHLLFWLGPPSSSKLTTTGWQTRVWTHRQCIVWEEVNTTQAELMEEHLPLNLFHPLKQHLNKNNLWNAQTISAIRCYYYLLLPVYCSY